MVMVPQVTALIRRLQPAFDYIKVRPKRAVAVTLLLFAGWGASHPQQFTDLWLTADQQGHLLFERKQYQQAANLFTDRYWRAYSQYGQQDFETAAQTWSQGDSVDDRFAQANALAHNSDFDGAAELYRQVIAEDANHQAAQFNLRLVEQLATQTPKSGGQSNKGTALRMNDDEQQTEETEDEAAVIPGPMPTDEMWLEQVNANPALFLQKKFLLEYDNAKRAATQPDREVR